MVDSIKPVVIHLICSSGFYGAERVVADLCSEMKNTELMVLCLANKRMSTNAFQDQINKSSAKFLYLKNRISQAIRELISIKKNKTKIIVHAHGYKANFIANIFNILSGCAIIVTQHGFTERNLKSRCYSWIDMALCRWFDIRYILCVSSNIYDRYLEFGVPSSRLVMSPNGIIIPDNVDRKCAKYQLTSQLSVLPATKLILYAGRLSEEKDPFLFLKTLDLLNKSGVEFCGIIAGDGPLSEAVSSRIDQLNLGSRIKMLGFVNDIDNLLSASDILLLTSITEGTPMIVLEAMARKCAVISTDVGGVSAIIKHNSNGILVESRDPKQLSYYCQTLLDNETQIQELRSCAEKTIIERYRLIGQIREHQRRYEELWR